MDVISKKFAIVVGEDVAGNMTVSNTENFKLLQEALSENKVTVLEVPPDENVYRGWVYDGTKFYDPESVL